MKESATYECKQCGNRFFVSETGEGHLSPLYCCGEEAKKRSKKKTSLKKPKQKKKATRKTD